MKKFLCFLLVLNLIDLKSQAKLLKDIYQFSSSRGFNSEQLLIGNTLYFIAKSQDEGNELWATDGTEINTRLVKEIYPGKYNDGDPHQLTKYKNELYFTALEQDHGRELWSSDGTTNGTQLVKDIFPGQSASFGSNESGSFIEYNGKLYFGASGSFAIGQELFVSDGTSSGTNLIADFFGSSGVTPAYIILFKNKLYFSGISDSGSGTQLMTYDDATNKITPVKKISPNGSSVSDLIAATSYFLFTASEAIYGNEIYISDGTANGTKILKDLSTGTSSSTVAFYAAINNKIFFCANGSLYVTDGTSNGTINLNMNCPISANVNGNLFYFGASNPSNNVGVELYVSDGTLLGTKLIKDINTGIASSNPGNLTFLKNKLYFSATTPSKGIELWESDGTDTGTKFLADIRPGTDGSDISRMTVLNNTTLFFYANDGLHGEEPWIYELQSTATKEEAKLKFNLKDINDYWIIDLDKETELNVKINLSILNFEGQEIRSITCTNEILTNGLQIVKPKINGLYIIKMENKGQISTLKTIVIN